MTSVSAPKRKPSTTSNAHRSVCGNGFAWIISPSRKNEHAPTPAETTMELLIPLQPSIFDIHASSDFVRQLRSHRRGDRVEMAVVGMRTREGTISTDQLRTFLEGVGLPVLGFLRDTQNYVHLAAHGLTLWDVGSARFERDREQWAPITAWVDA